MVEEVGPVKNIEDNEDNRQEEEGAAVDHVDQLPGGQTNSILDSESWMET